MAPPKAKLRRVQPWENPTGDNLIIQLAFWFRPRLQGESCYKVEWWPLL